MEKELKLEQREAEEVLQKIKEIETRELVKLDEVKAEELTDEDLELARIAIDYLNGEEIDKGQFIDRMRNRMTEVLHHQIKSQVIFINAISNKVARVWLEKVREEQDLEKQNKILD